MNDRRFAAGALLGAIPAFALTLVVGAAAVWWLAFLAVCFAWACWEAKRR